MIAEAHIMQGINLTCITEKGEVKYTTTEKYHNYIYLIKNIITIYI